MANIANWLSLAQAARQLGVTRQAVDMFCWKGKLDYVTTPLGRLIDPASVERLARERETRKRGAKVA